MGAADGVEVAGEVQVDLLHRHDLGIAAAGGPALHAEAGAERGLAQGDHRLLADPVQPVAQADRGGGLALAGRGRGDRGHQHKAAVGTVRVLGDPAQVELGDVATVMEQRRVRDIHPLGHGLDRLQLGRARDLDIRRYAHSCSLAFRGRSEVRERVLAGLFPAELQHCVDETRPDIVGAGAVG